ncbi:rRNA biogenesis protein RRP5 [Drosophila tropicalis]|uniref:rRNA biogenesis protein RRP5 n=1 Tax=Drosophila tropicalis TaxID=46794 RepID=UPI0035ABDAA1
MVPNEKSFPRGGIVHQESKSANSDSNIIFGATQKKIKKAPKPKDKQPNELDQDETNVGEQLEAFSAESLKFDTLQEEMLVMGVVRETSATSVQVALPGRLTARALVADISESYARVAKAAMAGDTSEYHDLTELFHVGQIVYGRAIKTDQLETKRVTIILSLKPADVHSQLQHTSIKKGFIFSGAIAEMQEHGYIIETGIQGLQAFVPNEESNENQLHVGQLAFLKVKQITHDKNQSTCTCQIISDQNKLKMKSQNETNLDYLLPGSIVRFKLSKHLKDGLKGSIMNENFVAYINEHHLGHPLHTLQDYDLNEEYNARVLYTMPLTKLVYLTLNVEIKARPEQDVEDEAEDQTELKKGSIVEKAKVLRLASGGVILLLNKQSKGLISYSCIKSHYKGNYDKDEVLSKYGRKTKHKVRVLGYDLIESLYYCSDDPNVVNEKLYTLEDLHPGDLVSARLIKQDTKINGGWSLKLGKINGIIDALYLAPGQRYEVGQRVRCRILDVNLERRTCYLSNRPEYLSKNAKLLTNLQSAQEGQVFTGTVVKSELNFFLVKFCNGLKGVLYKQQLKDQLSMTEGQTMKFRILRRQKEQIVLALPEDKFLLGEICPVEVTNSLDSGLQFKINYGQDADEEEEDYLGLIPIRLLSDYPELLHAQKRIYPVGTQTEAACINQNIFSVRDVPYFSEHETKDWQSVREGDILRAYVKNVTDQVIDVLVLVRNYNKLVKLHVKMLRLNAVRDASVTLVPEQLLYVKVLSKEPETKTLTVSAKLTDVWSGKLTETAGMVESYLQEVAHIRSSVRSLFSAPIAKYTIGEKINVVFKGIDPVSNDWLYSVDKSPKLTALLVASLAPSGHANAPAKGSKHQAVILWIDYASDVLLISNKRVDIEHITTSTDLPQNLMGKAGMKAKVLLKLESIAICSLKKKGVNPLVFCPIRLHTNDVENSASAGLRQGDFCNIGFIHDHLPIAVPENVWKLWRGVGVGVVTGVKRALEEETLSSPAVKTKKSKMEKGPLFFEDRQSAKRLEPPATETEAVPPPTRLPGVLNFWNESEASNAAADSSSSDEADETEQQDPKKRRLSSKAKAKAQVKEEQRLREIEERNADPDAKPETIDQYERLVLAQPNNSLTWLQYIAFLLSNTEIEKARVLARRAISTISFRESQELRNIWSALLNIELTYNSQNFDDVLKEALNSNDPLEIYLSLVDIFRKNNQKERLSGVLVTILNKFKSQLKVWSLAADAYFWLGRSDQVHALLQRALRTLPNSDHINCIVAFAKLFAKHDAPDMAQTLLDDVVTSYPKRTDIWLVYVDMLIKAQLIDAARNVLERAVVQKLRPNKMQVIYKKYLQLEENFGTEAHVANVKQQAEQWVRNYAKLAGAAVN